MQGMYGYGTLEDLDKAAEGFGYGIDDYDVYQDEDEQGPYFYALKKAIDEGNIEEATEIIEEHPEAAEQFKNETQGLLGDDFDFEAFAQEAQSEQDAKDAEKKAKEKANIEAHRGRGTQGMKLKSTGFLGGRHWYDASPETLAEYSKQLIEDGEGLLGASSGLGRELSENDAWNAGSRGDVGALATHGNGLVSKGKKLQALSDYFQKRGIEPNSLEPSQRKALMGVPLPGSKWNRKGTQEEYEHNLDVIANFPTLAPKVVENTVIKPLEQELGVEIPEEIKQDAIKEPEFVSSGIDWDKIIADSEKEHMGMGWNNGRVDDFDPNGLDFVSNDEPYEEENNEGDLVDNSAEGVVDYGLEDQNQYQERVDLNAEETVATDSPEANEADFEKVPGFENIDNVVQLKEKEEIEQEVDEDEDIPPEEKEETKERRLRLWGWAKSNGMNFSGAGGAPKSETKLPDTRVSGAGGSFGGMFKMLSAADGGGVSHLRAGQIAKNNEAKKQPSAMASRAGGGSKPVVPEGSSPVSIHAGRSGAVGFKNTSGNYSSGSVPHTSSTLSMRSVTSGYGGKAVSGKGVVPQKTTLSGGKATGNMGIDKFIDAIMKDSRTWEKEGDSGNKFDPYHVTIKDGKISINNMTVEKAVTKDPNCMSFIMKRIG